MDYLFTSTTVLLTEGFVKSYPKEALQSKLSKLRLVTGIQFSKANKTYAVTGKWDQVDSAFEILSHWHEKPDHEPGFENAWDGKIAQLCDCGIVNKFLTVTDQLHDQSESESRKVGRSNEADKQIDETVEILKKEYASLTSNFKHKRKGNKKVENSNISRKIKTVDKIKTDVRSVKRHTLSLNQKRKCTEKENCFKTNNKRSDTENAIGDSSILDSNNSSHRIVDDNDAVTDQASPVTDDLSSDGKSNRLSDLTISSDIELRSDGKKKNRILQSNPEYSQNDKPGNNADAEMVSSDSVHTSGRKQKKPGDKGYWSRVKRNDVNVAHQCPTCNVVLKSRKRYHEHMRRIHIKDYQCTVCEKRFGYPTDLNRHRCTGGDDKVLAINNQNVKKENTTVIPVKVEDFRCVECNYATPMKKRLSIHIQRSHRKHIACDQCDKMFGYPKDLNKHIENIHSDRKYFCDQCSKEYTNRIVFESHLKTHDIGYVKPSFICKVCEKSFTTKYSLASHLKSVHLGLNKEYLCQMCGKKFSQRSSYKQHCNAHNGIKPYKCMTCGKAFVYHKSLKEHKFMHDNIRRFLCIVCDKSFRQRTTLHIHLKTHKTVKDHACPYCGRGFSQKQAMERHERIHTGIRPYTCMKCKKSFSDTSTIRRHMVAIHQKTEANWRDDIISTVKKKSDYYVYGGSGQNRTYKTKAAATKESSVSRDKSTEISESPSVQPEPQSVPPVPQSVHPEPQSVQPEPQSVQCEQSLIVINPVQQDNIQDRKYDSVVNGAHAADAQDFHTLQNLQPGTIYAIATNQQQQVQQQNSTVSSALPINNGLSQVLDFSTMTFIATKVPQQSADKTEAGVYNVQPMGQAPGQNPNGVQTAALVPMTAGSECVKLGPAAASTPLSSDSSLSQAIASIWGFVGYPSYQNPSNLTQYQPQQNQ